MARKMGAPRKRGLAYFRMDVDFFEDDRIQDCVFDFGPVAVAVYMAILCIVYANGSHARMDRTKLIRAVKVKVGHDYFARTQGGKRKKDTVADVIDRFAEIGLIDKECLKIGIVTSREMQRRHRDASALTHRCLDPADYWLLEDPENEGDAEGLIKSPKNEVSSEESRFNSEESRDSSEVSTPKRKENKRKADSNISIYPSYPASTMGDGGMDADRIEEERPPASDYLEMADDVKRQIDYPELLSAHGEDRATIDSMASIILETRLARASTMTISGTKYPADLVRGRMESVRYEHIEYVLECLKASSAKVRNIKQYLLAVLFNAPATMDGYYEAAVRHDMPWLAQG